MTCIRATALTSLILMLLAACQSNPPQPEASKPLGIQSADTEVAVPEASAAQVAESASTADAPEPNVERQLAYNTSPEPVMTPKVAFRKAKQRHAEGDYKNMLALLHHSAASGYAPAQLALGDAYLNLPEQRDEGKARQWYQSAAEQGVPAAAFQLGVMMEAGIGGEQDHQQAAQWIGASARRGYAPAQFQVAQAMLQEQDPALHREAYQLMRQSADKGYPQAVYVLGRMYLHGVGVEKDVSKALPLLEQVAKTGNPDAEFEYGLALYSLEPRTVQSVTNSAAWFERSAAKGHPKAQAYLSKVHAFMNAPQVQQQSF